MARFAYLKSCYERLGHFHIYVTQVIVQNSINHSLKLITAIATNTVERDKEALKLTHR